MTKKSAQITIITAPDFSERLATAVEVSNVWILETEPNRLAAQKIWECPDYLKKEGSLTTFAKTHSTNEETVAALLYTVDLHHGEYSQDPPRNAIEVIGMHSTPQINSILEELNVDEIEETEEGFRGYRSRYLVSED